MAATDDYEPCDTIWEFLELKGSVGLLALLDERPRTYSELESEIEITSTTISRRRNDADHLGLLTVELESNEDGTKHVYTLTPMGEYLTRKMSHKGINSSYHKMRDRQKEIEEKTKELADWAQKNSADLYTINSELNVGPADRETPNLDEILDSGDYATETEASVENTDTGDDEEGADTDDGSAEQPHPPSKRFSADSEEPTEQKEQGKLTDISTDKTDSDQVDDDSDT